MQFLILFGLMLTFSWAFPKIFTAFYWLLMLTIFTIGPASFLFLGCLIFGVNLDFGACCMLSFIFAALPFTFATAPRSE